MSPRTWLWPVQTVIVTRDRISAQSTQKRWPSCRSSIHAEHASSQHFAMVGARIEGITAVGRATAELLDMNNDERVEMRAELQDCGEM